MAAVTAPAYRDLLTKRSLLRTHLHRNPFAHSPQSRDVRRRSCRKSSPCSGPGLFLTCVRPAELASAHRPAVLSSSSSRSGRRRRPPKRAGRPPRPRRASRPRPRALRPQARRRRHLERTPPPPPPRRPSMPRWPRQRHLLPVTLPLLIHGHRCRRRCMQPRPRRSRRAM